MNSTPGPGIVLFVQYMYMYVYKELMYPRHAALRAPYQAFTQHTLG